MAIGSQSQTSVYEPGAAHRDALWSAQVDLEVVRIMADREKRSIVANFLGLVACIVLAFAFPDPWIFTLPLVFRLLSMSFTRFAGTRLRRCLAEGTPYGGALNLVKIGLCIGGVSWGAMVWPLAQLDSFPPAAIAYAGFIMVGSALVLTLLGAIRSALFGYLGCFVVSAAIGIVAMNQDFSLFLLLGMVVVLTCAAAFSISVAKHNRLVAETMIDNQRLSEDLADALAHAEFLSQRDPLTGLMSRRAFLDRTCILEGGKRLQLLAIDLDHFKSINDEFGHDMGDRVLVGVGDLLRELCREFSDDNHLAVRLGGEEFLVVVDTADPVIATSFAETIRARIAGLTEILAIPELRISASIGQACWLSDNPLTDALKSADDALYAAKDAGRNRVVREAA